MGKNRIRNNTKHISESIEIIFRDYNDLIQTGMDRIRIENLGWKMFGSVINIPDPHH
jgi:hypothetical protein